MSDWDFYGNQWAVQLLKTRVSEDSLKHAYLISGPQNVGKTTFAIKFTQSLFCENIQPDSEPCGKCISCSKIEREQHFDLKVARREPGSRDFKLEQVLDAEKFLSITPYSSTHKIVVFPDFAYANTSAQNAILKTLEEAPSYAILILIAENTSNILPTVLSRCEKIDLRNADLGTIRKLISDRFPGQKDSELIARISEGRPGLAIRYCEPNNKRMLERKKAIHDFFEFIQMPFAARFDYNYKLTDTERISTTKARKSAKKWAPSETDESYDEVDLLANTLNTWLTLTRDALIMSKASKVEIINMDFEKELDQLVQAVGEANILEAVEILQTAIKQNFANVNKRLLLDVVASEIFKGRLVKFDHADR